MNFKKALQKMTYRSLDKAIESSRQVIMRPYHEKIAWTEIKRAEAAGRLTKKQADELHDKLNFSEVNMENEELLKRMEQIARVRKVVKRGMSNQDCTVVLQEQDFYALQSAALALEKELYEEERQRKLREADISYFGITGY